MPKTKPPYPGAFKQQIVELAMAGRSPAELARELDSARRASLHGWRALRPEPQAGTQQRRVEQRRTRRAGPIATPRAPARTGARHPGKVTAWFAGKDGKTSSGSTNS